MTTLTCTAQYDGLHRILPREYDAVDGGDTVRFDATLRGVDPADAPVAARVPRSYAFPSAPDTSTADIRLFEGSLYRQLRYWQGLAITPEIVRDAPTGGFFLGIYRTEDEALNVLRDTAAGIILIDGECWEKTAEPVIEVRLSGLIVRAAGEADRAGRVYHLTEQAAAFDAARATTPVPKYLTGSRVCTEGVAAIEILIPSAFTAPSDADKAKAGQHVASKVAAAAITAETLVPENLRAAARMLLEAADEYDAAVSPESPAA